MRTYIGPHKAIFAKRHYEAIAAILTKYDKNRSDIPGAVAYDLSVMFEDDNPNFNRDKFMKAAGFGDGR